MQLSREAAFLIEHLDLPEAVGSPDAIWETYQLFTLCNTNILSIDIKSRQVGWSWTAAADASAAACLYPKSTCIFVSINQDEASEKIRYSRQIMEALDSDVRPRLIRDHILGLELQNGSRLISYPCRPPRGPAKTRLYLDEFAHYPADELIYQAALPIIAKGGVVRIGSSPFGASGKFWEIYTQATHAYPGYTRNAVPWWAVDAFCKDVELAESIALSMTTEERVARFGTERLIIIFENSALGDFQQEFECNWLDEAVAWLEWDLIKQNQQLDAAGKHWQIHADGVDAALAAINEVREQIMIGKVEYTLLAGMDIGRVHDLSEIFVLGESPSGSMPVRLSVSLSKVKFELQQTVIDRMLDILPIRRMLIDKTGMGMQIAEHAEENYNGRAAGMPFTSETKELMAVEIKKQFQNSKVPIPLDRALGYQLNSVRRIATGGKNLSYDTKERKEHHADKFWALALALYAPKFAGFSETTEGENIFVNYRG